MATAGVTARDGRPIEWTHIEAPLFGHHTTGRERPPKTEPGRLAMRTALAGVVLLAAAMGFVSYAAQRAMVLQVKHDPLAAALEAFGPDLGALVFGTLGYAEARRGASPMAARMLSLLCVAAAIVMNALAVGTGSAKLLAVATAPPVLYALAADRLIAVVRRRARARGTLHGEDRGPGLLLLRLACGPFSFLAQGRRWVLDNVPVLPSQSAAAEHLAELAALREQLAGMHTQIERVRADEQRRAAEREQVREAERERMLAQLTRELTAGRAQGGTRVQSKSAAFRDEYRRLHQAGDPRLTDPDYPRGQLLADITTAIADQVGELSPGASRRLLAEMAAEVGGVETGTDPDMMEGGAA